MDLSSWLSTSPLVHKITLQLKFLTIQHPQSDRSQAGIADKSQAGIADKSQAGIADKSQAGIADKSQAGIADKSQAGIADKSLTSPCKLTQSEFR